MPYNMAFRTKGTLLTLRAQFLLYGVNLHCVASLWCSTVVAIHLSGKNTLVVQEMESNDTATRDNTTLCYS